MMNGRIGKVRMAEFIVDTARASLLPEIQSAFAQDKTKAMVGSLKSALAQLPGAGAAGIVALPVMLPAIVIASKFDGRIAKSAETMSPILRAGVCFCFVATLSIFPFAADDRGK